MSKKIEDVLYKIYHGDVEHDFYIKNEKLLNEINYNAIKMLYLFGFIYILIVSCLTLVSDVVGAASVMHYSTLACLLICSIFVLTAAKKNSRLIKPLYIILIILLLGNSLYIGVYVNPNLPAVIYLVNLITLPVLFIDKPGKSMLIVTFGSIVFSIAVITNKQQGPDIIEVNLLNLVFAVIIAYMIVFYTRNLNLSNIQSKVRFKEQSQLDQLSGVNNKMHTENLCKEYINSLGNQEFYTFMVLDVDDFKLVNDTYGHKKGDEIIEIFGRILRSSVRTTDIVGRIGGDEFVLLFKSMDSPQVAVNRAEQIQQKILLQGKAIGVDNLSLSIGIVVGNPENRSFEDLFDVADRMLYRAKKDGKMKACLEILNEKETSNG